MATILQSPFSRPATLTTRGLVTLGQINSVAGWIYITDATSSLGVVSNKTFQDSPGDTVIESASSSSSVVSLLVNASYPLIDVNGTQFTLSRDVSGGFYSDSVDINVPVDGVITARVITPSNVVGSSHTINISVIAPPQILTLAFTGSYPGSQTELKAGDTFQVTGTTDVPSTGVEVLDFGAAVSSVATFSSATSFNVTITIADRGTSPQALVARLRARDASGAYGQTFDTTNTVILNNLAPTLTFGAVTYPPGQSALKDAETASVAVTLANYDSVVYSSPNGDLSIVDQTGPIVVSRISGDYNISTVNLTGTATRLANGRTTNANKIVNVANVAPTITVSVPASRLRSGGNNGTSVQGHTVTITANQNLGSAPALSAGAGGGTFIGGAFTGGPTVWTRTLNVHDDDVKGNYTFTGLTAVGLSGLAQNAINSGANYVLGGFVARTLTFAPFSQTTTINTAVVTYNNLRAGTFTATNQSALRNAVQGNTDNIANTYTVTALSSNPTTLFWNDQAAASSNSSGTASITAVEEIA